MAGDEEGEDALGALELVVVVAVGGEDVVIDLGGCLVLVLAGCCFMVAVSLALCVVGSASVVAAVASEGGAGAELATLAAHDDLDIVGEQ